MWSEFFICNKVTCVKAIYNEVPLGAFKFKQIALCRWLQFAIHIKGGRKQGWLSKHSTAFDDFNLIKAFTLTWKKNIPLAELTMDEIAEHLCQCQYFPWRRGLIFISHPSLCTADSSVRKEANTKRERGVRLEQCEHLCVVRILNVGQTPGGQTLYRLRQQNPSACQEKLIYSVAFTSGWVHLCVNSSHKDMFLFACAHHQPDHKRF